MSDTVHLVDCTLREGDQTAGVAMTVDEKLQIAEMLDDAGVPLADAGMPAVNPSEAQFGLVLVTAGKKNKHLVTVE